MKKQCTVMFALLVSLVVLLLLQPVCAQAADITAEGACGENVRWVLSGDTLTISGSGPMDDAVHSDLESSWYTYKSQIRHVVIEEGVTTVGAWAFSNHRSIKTVKIPNSVTVIKTMAFNCCEGVQEITLGNSIVTIEEMAFFSCFEVRELLLPQTLRSIGVEAFGDCWSLEKITIPEGVTTIPDGAFRNTAIKEVRIPVSVTQIGYWAFKYCEELQKVYYAGTEDQWKAVSVDNKEDGNAFFLNAEFIFKQMTTADITADGAVDNNDVVLLLWHTLFPEDYPLAVSGDLTGDGAIDNNDVVLLLWHTLFPEEYPL